MPVRLSGKSSGADSPPTPDMSPKSGSAVLGDDMGSRNALGLKCALQGELAQLIMDRGWYIDLMWRFLFLGVLSVREHMWEELVLRRDLGESPDERVRYERMRFEEMLVSYSE